MAILLTGGPGAGASTWWARAWAIVWFVAAGACGGTTTISACTTDAECAAGLVCRQRECTSSALTCDKNPCPDRMDCVEHECRWRCGVTDDCPQGANCRAGHCLWPTCTAHTDCAAGKACIQGECVTATCRENIECGTDGVCRAGTCIVVGECLTDTHCRLGQTCVNGTCQGVPISSPAVPCRINADCPAGQACFLEFCWDT